MISSSTRNFQGATQKQEKYRSKQACYELQLVWLECREVASAAVAFCLLSPRKREKSESWTKNTSTRVSNFVTETLWNSKNPDSLAPIRKTQQAHVARIRPPIRHHDEPQHALPSALCTIYSTTILPCDYYLSR